MVRYTVITVNDIKTKTSKESEFLFVLTNKIYLHITVHMFSRKEYLKP